MKFDDIIGQRPTIQLLRRALSSGRLPHALLFQGPEGVGKGTVARALAAALVCEAAGDEACERCVSCLKVRHRNHPDLLVIRRVSKKIRESAPMDDAPEGAELDVEDKDLSPFVRVFQIRELSLHAAFSPREARRRVFIVDPADCMNEEAQNALLKTLEEPPGGAVLILVASRPHLLLATVRSRCLAVRLGPLSAPELARALESRGMPRAEAAARATLARGRPGRALRMDVETLGRRRNQILGTLEALAASPHALSELPAMVSAICGKGETAFLEGLDLLEELLRDSTRIASGLRSDSSLDTRLSARLGRLGERIGADRSAGLVRSIEKLRSELRFNLNHTLLTESLLSAVAGGPLP